MEQATKEIRHNPPESQEDQDKKDQARTVIKKALFLDYFRKTMGIVDAAAKGADLHRDTVYDWRKKDQAFALAMDQIVDDGPEIAEQQLKLAILRGYMPSVHFYLSRRHPAYKQKIEHSGVVLNIYGQLTDEQKFERLRRIVATQGGGAGQRELDLLNGGNIELPENGGDPQKGGAEVTGSGKGKEGDVSIAPGPLENNRDNHIVRAPAIDTKPEPAGVDNQRAA